MNLKIYVTHYSPLKERYIFIKDQLDKYNFNYEFITEYDKENLTAQNFSKFKLNKLKISAISLFLKHIYSYKKIIDEINNSYYLILEDDVILCDNFKNKLELYLSQLPEDFDMLFIGNGCNQHIPNKIIQPNKYIYFKNNIPLDNQSVIDNWNVDWGLSIGRCTDSYLISKNCANKIFNYFNNINKNTIYHPVDFWLNDIMKILNLNIYWAEPTIISQGSQCGKFNSTIGVGMIKSIGKKYYLDSDNVYKYIFFLLKHFDPWCKKYLKNSIPSDDPIGYSHCSNQINTTILSNNNIIKLLKKQDSYIYNFISNCLFHTILNSSLTNHNLHTFLDSLFITDKKYENNIVYLNFLKTLTIITNPKKKFIRHFLEDENKHYFDINSNDIYPPKNTYYHYNNCWPIEYGSASLRREDIESNILHVGDSNGRHCQITPIIDSDIFDKYNGKFIIGYNEQERNHLYANAEIPFSEWIILLENKNINKEYNIKTLEHLLNINIPVIDIEIITIYKIFKEVLIMKLLSLKKVNNFSYKKSEKNSSYKKSEKNKKTRKMKSI